MRQERVVFDGIYRRMEADLEKCKAEMAQIIEESNQAYEVRDGATVQLLDLQSAMAREQEDFEREMTSLDQRIDSEDKRARELQVSARLLL